MRGFASLYFWFSLFPVPSISGPPLPRGLGGSLQAFSSVDRCWPLPVRVSAIPMRVEIPAAIEASVG